MSSLPSSSSLSPSDGLLHPSISREPEDALSRSRGKESSRESSEGKKGEEEETGEGMGGDNAAEDEEEGEGENEDRDEEGEDGVLLWLSSSSSLSSLSIVMTSLMTSTSPLLLREGDASSCAACSSFKAGRSSVGEGTESKREDPEQRGGEGRKVNFPSSSSLSSSSIARREDGSSLVPSM